jgi:hypothetical protein
MASIARRFAVMGQVDPDIAAWRDVVKFIGGSVSTAALSIASRFVDRDKASGAWDLTDDYWPFWGETLWQAIVSLKQRRGANLINMPVHVPRRHIATSGTTSYIDTGFIPNSHKVAATSTNVRLAQYLRDNVSSSTTYSAGAISSSNRNLRMRPRFGSDTYLEASSTFGTYTLPAATSGGYTALSRDAAAGANSYGYKNGVAMVQTSAPVSFGSTLPVVSIFVGGQNNGGALQLARATSCGFMAFGATLSAGQELAQYQAVQEWATAIGANV